MTGDDLNEQLRRASEAQQKFSDYLMGLPHVLGVAVGYTEQEGHKLSEIGLIVLVDEKLPEAQLTPEHRVPRELDGVRVDVQVMGSLTAL